MAEQSTRRAEIASALRNRARDLTSMADDLKYYADQLDPPDLPEPSRSSHQSG